VTYRERAFPITSDGLRLEGALSEGDGHLLAVVLHPHPPWKAFGLASPAISRNIEENAATVWSRLDE
jgi:hypothetical protein